MNLSLVSALVEALEAGAGGGPGFRVQVREPSGPYIRTSVRNPDLSLALEEGLGAGAGGAQIFEPVLTWTSIGTPTLTWHRPPIPLQPRTPFPTQCMAGSSAGACFEGRPSSRGASRELCPSPRISPSYDKPFL